MKASKNLLKNCLFLFLIKEKKCTGNSRFSKVKVKFKVKFRLVQFVCLKVRIEDLSN